MGKTADLGIDFFLWAPGILSLALVIVLGFYIVRRSIGLGKARSAMRHRIMVTGSRGKSGSVRLIHAALSESGLKTYAKITGKVAVELGTSTGEKPTTRFGSVGVTELADALIRAGKDSAELAVFECMAVQPALIELAQSEIIKPDIVVIPTIRPDHLEDEGYTVNEIGLSILRSIGKPRVLVSAIDQPFLIDAYQRHCLEQGIKFILVHADHETPVVIGHHPTNIAIAMAVASELGVSLDDAKRGIEKATFEPETLTIWQLERSSRTIDFCVLGGANDPQSSAEAVRRSGLLDGTREIVPVLVNRWDRPLRALSFSTAISGQNVRAAIIAGSIYPWAKKDLLASGVAGENIIFMSRSLAKKPRRLLKQIDEIFADSEKRITLVTLGNVHNETVDELSKLMHKRAKELHIEPKEAEVA